MRQSRGMTGKRAGTATDSGHCGGVEMKLHQHSQKQKHACKQHSHTGTPPYASLCAGIEPFRKKIGPQLTSTHPIVVLQYGDRVWREGEKRGVETDLGLDREACRDKDQHTAWLGVETKSHKQNTPTSTATHASMQHTHTHARIDLSKEDRVIQPRIRPHGVCIRTHCCCCCRRSRDRGGRGKEEGGVETHVEHDT